MAEYSLFSFLTNPFFTKTHFFLNSLTKMSFIDLTFINESDALAQDRELFEFLMWDFSSYVYNNFLPLQVIFYTDYQNLLVTILYNSPELAIALMDFVETYWTNSFSKVVPSAVFDFFTDSNIGKISECLDYCAIFIVFMWLAIITLNVFRLMNWTNPLEIHFVRFYNYLFSMSRGTRVQFEAALQVLLFVLFYATMMIATFDDDQAELLEFFNTMCFYFFALLLFFFIYKYSIHYFAFLEASVAEGSNLNFAWVQFSKDVLNTFAFVLRFFVLTLRLNIYDALDDFYDSYYIYVGDFDDDEYLIDLMLPAPGVTFFYADSHDDKSVHLEDEVDFIADLFSVYFVIWGKLTLFVFFIIEELLRLALALYVTYLIVFEVHAINRSYVEDTYFATKRIIFKSNSTFSNL